MKKFSAASHGLAKTPVDRSAVDKLPFAGKTPPVHENCILLLHNRL